MVFFFPLFVNLTLLLSQLLCQYERRSVLKFLETFDSYRLERCLHLCLDYGVTDAAAFLQERVGDVGSALALILAGLDEKISVFISSVENTSSGVASKSTSETKQPDIALEMNEVYFPYPFEFSRFVTSAVWVLTFPTFFLRLIQCLMHYMPPLGCAKEIHNAWTQRNLSLFGSNCLTRKLC